MHLYCGMLTNDIYQAIAQARSLEEIVKGYEIDATKKGLPRDEYQRLEVKKKQSSEQYVGWVERSEALRMKLDNMEEKVKLFCASKSTVHRRSDQY